MCLPRSFFSVGSTWVNLALLGIALPLQRRDPEADRQPGFLSNWEAHRLQIVLEKQCQVSRYQSHQHWKTARYNPLLAGFDMAVVFNSCLQFQPFCEANIFQLIGFYFKKSSRQVLNYTWHYPEKEKLLMGNFPLCLNKIVILSMRTFSVLDLHRPEEKLQTTFLSMCINNEWVMFTTCLRINKYLRAFIK